MDSPKKKKVEKPQDGHQKSCQNIGNPYQMEDNKSPKGAAPKAPPCCLPFGNDFLCLGLIFGAHPEAFPPFFWTVYLPWYSQFIFETKSDRSRSIVQQPLKKKVDSPKKKEGGKASGWGPEITPKHLKSLPNGRQQEPFAPPPWGGAEGAALFSSIW